MDRQTFNDGVVRIYGVQNAAQNGDLPREQLTLKETLRVHRRTVGMRRYYAAMQANEQIDAVLRCPYRASVCAQDIARWNGKQYRVMLVQYPEDVAPPVMDLTLTKVEQDAAITDD